MASESDREPQTSTIQIYPTSKRGISQFWKDKYEREARKYWDIFYKNHRDRFFKDRHYLDKEWRRYFSGAKPKVVLEVGCGAGNTIFPLIATYPDVFVHACDFSPRAVSLVRMHKDFTGARVSAFVCDLTIDDLNHHISPSSVDIVTMIFVLSAVSPEKMLLVLRNIKKVLKPDGYILFRDYATGDLAQERFTCKDQMISENFYARGDGTRAFYFSNEFLTNLFEENGFSVEDLDLCCKQVENRSRELVMNRRWVQAVFRISNGVGSSNIGAAVDNDTRNQQKIQPETKKNASKEVADGPEVDMSEGLANEMFGISPFTDNETMEINLDGQLFQIKVFSKEYQHTCKSTGLMLWESARLMSSILASNRGIIAGKRVLELGSGCGGLCSMAAVRSADLVIATDGDSKALQLLAHNVSFNIKPPFLDKMITAKLEWGNKEQIKAIKEVTNKGFDIILGTDVTYVAEAIVPLFSTAKELISSSSVPGETPEPALILCHVFRRVDEPSILAAASQFGFRLIDKWPTGSPSNHSQSIISTWFKTDIGSQYIHSALNIMYFCTTE